MSAYAVLEAVLIAVAVVWAALKVFGPLLPRVLPAADRALGKRTDCSAGCGACEGCRPKGEASIRIVPRAGRDD
jgi:hypothetical protein